MRVDISEWRLVGILCLYICMNARALMGLESSDILVRGQAEGTRSDRTLVIYKTISHVRRYHSYITSDLTCLKYTTHHVDHQTGPGQELDLWSSSMPY